VLSVLVLPCLTAHLSVCDLGVLKNGECAVHPRRCGQGNPFVLPPLPPPPPPLSSTPSARRQHGQLGIGTLGSSVTSPTSIKSLEELEVVRLAAGGSHSLVAVTHRSLLSSTAGRLHEATTRLRVAGQLAPTPSGPDSGRGCVHLRCEVGLRACFGGGLWCGGVGLVLDAAFFRSPGLLACFW
jgi:hypothetical protein